MSNWNPPRRTRKGVRFNSHHENQEYKEQTSEATRRPWMSAFEGINSNPLPPRSECSIEQTEASTDSNFSHVSHYLNHQSLRNSSDGITIHTLTSRRKPGWWWRMVGLGDPFPYTTNENEPQLRGVMESYASSVSSNRRSALPNFDSFNGGSSDENTMKDRQSLEGLEEGSEENGTGETITYLAQTDGVHTLMHSEQKINREDWDEVNCTRTWRRQRRITHNAMKAKLVAEECERSHLRKKLFIFIFFVGIALIAFIMCGITIAMATIASNEEFKSFLDRSSAKDASSSGSSGASGARYENGVVTSTPTISNNSHDGMLGNDDEPSDKASKFSPVGLYVHSILMSISLWMSLVVIFLHIFFPFVRKYSLPYVFELTCSTCGYWSTMLLRIALWNELNDASACFFFCLCECFFHFCQTTFTCAMVFKMYRSVVSYADVLVDSRSAKKHYWNFTRYVILLSLVASIALSYYKFDISHKSHRQTSAFTSSMPTLQPVSQLLLYVYYPLIACAFNLFFYLRFTKTIGGAYPVAVTGRLNMVAQSYLILFLACWGSVIVSTVLEIWGVEYYTPTRIILTSVFDSLGLGTAIITFFNIHRCRTAFDFGLSLKTIDSNRIVFDEPLNILGEGTFAVVVKATWLQGKRFNHSRHLGFQSQEEPHSMEVAVKTFKCTQFDNVDHIRREAYLSSKLVHPYIMTTYGCYTDKNNLYIVSEYLGGGTLQDIIDANSNLPYATILQYAYMIASGMRFLHGLPVPIIHRDLKPYNCLFDSKKELLKLADFGESRLFLRERTTGEYKAPTMNTNPVAIDFHTTPVDLTLQMTTNIGSACWAAPEILKDEETSAYSIKVDVYSFGIICWQLYTCKVPYVEIPGSVLAVAEEVMNGRRPEIPSSCPSIFAKIMRRCWHENPLRRPTFEDIVRLLEMEITHEKQRQTIHSSFRSDGISQEQRSNGSNLHNNSNSGAIRL